MQICTFVYSNWGGVSIQVVLILHFPLFYRLIVSNILVLSTFSIHVSNKFLKAVKGEECQKISSESLTSSAKSTFIQNSYSFGWLLFIPFDVHHTLQYFATVLYNVN